MKAGQLTIAADELNTGEHTIQVIAHGWQDSVVKTSTSTSLNNVTSKNIVYPNPAKDKLYIVYYNEGLYSATLLSIAGSEVLTIKLLSGINELDVHTLPRGTYLLKMSSASKVKSQIILLK